MEIKLYTSQECIFLDQCLSLFGVKANIKEVTDVISYTSYVISTDKDTEDIIKRCLAYNYNKNFK